MNMAQGFEVLIKTSDQLWSCTSAEFVSQEVTNLSIKDGTIKCIHNIAGYFTVEFKDSSLITFHNAKWLERGFSMCVQSSRA